MRNFPLLIFFAFTLITGAGGTLVTLSSAGSAPASPVEPPTPIPESITHVLAETDTAVPYTLSDLGYAPIHSLGDPIGTDSLNAKIARMIAVALQLRPQAPVTVQGSGNYSQADLDRALDIARRNNENTRTDISRSIADTTSSLTLGGSFTDPALTNADITTLTVSGATTFNDPLTIAQTSAPAATTDKLYNLAGDLYWAGNPVSSAAIGQWASDGTNVWRTGGNVGIGTTAPEHPLDVDIDNVAASLALRTHGTGSSGGSFFRAMFSRGTREAPLIVNSSDRIGAMLFSAYDGAGTYSTAARIEARMDGAPSPGDMPGRLVFSTAPSGSASVVDQMVIASQGNVGIGTTNPGEMLHVSSSGGAPVVKLESTAPASSEPRIDIVGKDNLENSLWGFFGIKGGGGAGSTAVVSGSITNHDYFLKTNNATRLTIKATSGNVGIGTTMPGTKLQVDGNIAVLQTAASEKYIGFSTPNSPTYAGTRIGSFHTAPWGGDLRFYTLPPAGSGGDFERMRITGSGSIGIGTTTPQTRLQVDGVISPALDNTYTLGNSTYRFSEVYAANGVINTSDIRLKHDPQTLTYGLDTILALEPISYTWVDQPTQGTRFGLSAQHVRDLIPEIVAEGADPDRTLGIRYTELIPILINAVQELAGTVATLAEGTFDTVFAKTIVVENEIEADGVTAREDVHAGRNIEAEGTVKGQELRSDGRLCVGNTCVTEAEFIQMVMLANQTPAPQPAPTTTEKLKDEADLSALPDKEVGSTIESKIPETTYGEQDDVATSSANTSPKVDEATAATSSWQSAEPDPSDTTESEGDISQPQSETGVVTDTQADGSHNNPESDTAVDSEDEPQQG